MSHNTASVILYQKKMQLLVDAFDSGIDKIMREWNLDDRYYSNLNDIELQYMLFEYERAKDDCDLIRLVETIMDKLRIYQIPPCQTDEIIRDMRKNVNNAMSGPIQIFRHDVMNTVDLIDEQDHLERYMNNVKDTANQHISNRWKVVKNKQNVLIEKLECVKKKLVDVCQRFNTVRRHYLDGREESLQRANIVEHQNDTLELPTFIQWRVEERNT